MIRPAIPRTSCRNWKSEPFKAGRPYQIQRSDGTSPAFLGFDEVLEIKPTKTEMASSGMAQECSTVRCTLQSLSTSLTRCLDNRSGAARRSPKLMAIAPGTSGVLRSDRHLVVLVPDLVPVSPLKIHHGTMSNLATCQWICSTMNLTKCLRVCN